MTNEQLIHLRDKLIILPKDSQLLNGDKLNDSTVKFLSDNEIKVRYLMKADDHEGYYMELTGK